MPQATYGKEAGGVCITTVNKLRSFAAAAVSSKAAGQCPTVLIWVTLGMHYDPLVKCIVDQIKKCGFGSITELKP